MMGGVEAARVQYSLRGVAAAVRGGGGGVGAELWRDGLGRVAGGGGVAERGVGVGVCGGSVELGRGRAGCGGWGLVALYADGGVHGAALCGRVWAGAGGGYVCRLGAGGRGVVHGAERQRGAVDYRGCAVLVVRAGHGGPAGLVDRGVGAVARASTARASGGVVPRLRV